MLKTRVRRLVKWLDKNILLVLGGFLLAFIPLFPKLPLFDAIPGYIVRVRLEDLLVGVTAIVWLIQVIRKKAEWKTPLTPFILAYAVIGLLSTLSAVFITQTVPLEPLHVGKTVLHYFRYLEYFALFFFISSAVKTRRDLKILIFIVLGTLLGIGIYGIGQKYFYWPVYSTMNREFSKGIRLYLTEHARVQSTFGGHYDLAGYLVLVLPMLLALYLSVANGLKKHGLGILFILSLWLVVVSGARSSFIAFVAASALVVLLKALKQAAWKQKILYFLSRYAAVMFATLIMLFTFGDDMYDRLVQGLEGYPTVYNAYRTTIKASNKISENYILIPLGVTKEFRNKLRSGQFFGKPENAISTEDAEVLVASDQRPVSDKPSDVYVDVPDIKRVATISAEGNLEYQNIEVPRTYSENAKKYGLSVAIRLDYLWPKAIEGFMSNPLLGSGYATLTKETVYHFTEAESTDNNFLRTLGETGILGFATFYGAIAFAIYWAYQLYKKGSKSVFVTSLAIGYIAASVGLLINATYIDVYAASKVAFTFWSMTGILFALVQIEFGNQAIPFLKYMNRFENRLRQFVAR